MTRDKSHTRRITLSAAAGIAAVVLIVPALAGAGFGNVVVEAGGDNAFGPRKIDTTLGGGIVGWQWGDDGLGTAREHNVRQDDKLFYSGEPTDNDSVPVKQFPAGKFHYYCENHGSESGGMDGVIKIVPSLGLDGQGGEIEIVWAYPNNDVGKLFDVRFRVDNREWKIWKNDTSKIHGFFGRNDKPVNYHPNNHTYRVSARAEKLNTNKHSGWSPPVVFGGPD